MSVPIVGAVGTASHSTVTSAGMPDIVGAVVSSTVIVCVSVTMFPHSSSAVHSLVKIKLPAHAPGVVVSFKVILGFASQLSVAVMSVPIAGGVGTTPHPTVTSAGIPVIVGACVSATTIRCVSVVTFPQLSSAVHSLSMIYSPAQLPGVIFSENKISTFASQLSVAVMSVPITGAVGIASHSTDSSAGTPDNTGAVLS